MAFLDLNGVKRMWSDIKPRVLLKADNGIVDGTIKLNDSTITPLTASSSINASQLPIAKETTVGAVKGDGNVKIDTAGSMTYTLPVANDITLGGVKGDGNVKVDSDGSMTYTLPTSTSTDLGGVKVGSGVDVTSDGVISVALENYLLKTNYLDGYFKSSSASTLMKSAAFHNGIYRGDNLLSRYTLDELSVKVANSDFSDIFIGDYIDKEMTSEYATEKVRWLVAGLNVYKEDGDSSTPNHIVLLPEDCFKTVAQMNSTNTTAGAYVGSTMYTEVLPKYSAAIVDAFGSGHVLSHRMLLSTAINATTASGAGAGWAGCSSSWEWKDTTLHLLSEVEVYGSRVLSSSFYDVGSMNQQLPLFILDKHAKHAGLGYRAGSKRYDWWLSSVASATNFTGVHYCGYAVSYNAFCSGGVRPAFLFH